MATASGGIGAAFGFRYQYLVTVEVLLDLYESGEQGWELGVDLAGQDSADIFVRSETGAHRAIQVKASAPTSSTRMGLPAVERYLAAMQSEHPGIAVAQITTNRLLSPPAQEYVHGLVEPDAAPRAPRRVVDARQEGIGELHERLVRRIARVRAAGAGGADPRVHHLLLSRLLDLVGERGSRSTAQTIDRTELAQIVEGSAQTLAAVTGSRTWGRTFGVPLVNAVARPHIEGFLSACLRAEDRGTGSPPVAVVAGLSGTGKSTAVARWASLRRENYAFTLWMDAASGDALAAQQIRMQELLGGEPSVDGDPALSFREMLGAIPAPWLLVLDGAQSYEQIRDWVPVSGYGQVVITSSAGDWPADAAPLLRVEGMSDADAAALVRLRLASRTDAPDTADDVIGEFVRRLGSWPLAVDVACAWVTGLGGDLARLPDFVARLDRFPFGDEHPAGVAYPRSMTHIVGELWGALSAEAQIVLLTIVSNAGGPVPLSLLESWASALRSTPAPVQVDVGEAVDELTALSLVRRLIPADTRPSPLDEVLNVHDGIRAFLQHEGFGVPIGYVYAWLETMESALSEQVNDARMSEAALLLEAADGFLTTLVQAAPVDEVEPVESLQLLATVTMHNLGTVALLMGLLDKARRWFAIALNLRDRLRSGTVDGRADVIQLQTLS
ncbi:MAG: hypothetical protein WA971_05305, partial [Microbacterium sp.]